MPNGPSSSGPDDPDASLAIQRVIQATMSAMGPIMKAAVRACRILDRHELTSAELIWAATVIGPVDFAACGISPEDVATALSVELTPADFAEHVESVAEDIIVHGSARELIESMLYLLCESAVVRDTPHIATAFVILGLHRVEPFRELLSSKGMTEPQLRGYLKKT